MKILVYNWTPFDDKFGRGGGVSVYLRNILPGLIKDGHEVVFLNSGRHYSIFDRRVRIVRRKNLYSDLGLQSYELVNSPVKAPGRDSFYEPELCLNDPVSSKALVEFVKEHDGFDQIHFHNVEGVSTRSFDALKKETSVKIIIWLHNYHLFCPQMELLQNQKAHCSDFRDGKACINCLPQHFSLGRKIFVQRILSDFETRLGRPGYYVVNSVRSLWSSIKELRPKTRRNSEIRERAKGANSAPTNTSKYLAPRYMQWRATNVERVNMHVDACIAVSQQVKDIAVNFGVRAGLVTAVPLGVDVYKEDFRERGKYRWRLSRKKPKKVIAFIGYASKAKGFDLFLDALQNLRDLSDHFEILVVSKHVESYKARLNEVAKNFSLQHIDGYERSQLVDLYNDIDLAVVPSIWKETFNQVSYEATMYGVPVVMSDSLGISAYMPPTLNFESNNYHQLAQKIRRCLEDQNYIDDYWDSDQFSLLSLKQHESIVNSVIKRIA